MLFSPFTSTLLVLSAVLTVTASPAPAPQPIPEPAPIEPSLQPIIAAKNNLAGVAVLSGDPRFNTTENHSNAAITSHIPSTYVSTVSIMAGTLLVSFL
ncbi:hypothetical protein FPV67DRAFT_1668255 [Lyophyllum atratum]|nr:hypothetical protein FPV67DRAFT_1668255 [Lyophyllum atratum]